MKYLKLLLCLLIVNLVPSAYASAKTPNAFQIEVIAFMPKQPNLSHQDNYPPKPDLRQAQALEDTDEPIQPYMQLPDDKLRLTKEAQKIASHYHLLLHLAWVQKDEQRRPIKIERPQVMGLPLTGTIQVSKGYYYYFNNDLLLGEHTAIKSTRRIKKDELHYIDNPVISLLVTIHPVTLEDSEKAIASP